MEHEERLKTALADRYQVERKIGEGGMATVYLAQDLKHDRQVAVKVLRPEVVASLGTERFLAEIHLTARLQHPHIVPLFDSGKADAFLYYVMPYVQGESLRARLEREQRLDVQGMLGIARPVAQALAAAHELGVVHRDIKPENILLSRGEPLVTDFGIARAVSVAGGERLTATGVSVGTPAYMSPEQVLGEESLDERSDVYSLGCVIYEMLSGAPPFGGATVQALLARRLTGPPPHLANVPSPVDEVIRRSLATAPQDRFGTALALADALVEAARKAPAADLSIVVLPFENLSPDPDNAFFAGGLTEELIADLSRVRALKVISRTSAMAFKNTTKTIPMIAQELNVRYALEGSVRRA
ncbi:MAG: serine/threonine-protein kinase, partial [Gemmatimonadota bacterium]